MRADDGADLADLNVSAHTLDRFFEFLCDLGIVRVSDEDSRLLEVLAVSLNVFDKGVNNMAPASDFADVFELTGLVAAYERLDLKRLAEGCRDC